MSRARKAGPSNRPRRCRTHGCGYFAFVDGLCHSHSKPDRHLHTGAEDSDRWWDR